MSGMRIQEPTRSQPSCIPCMRALRGTTRRSRTICLDIFIGFSESPRAVNPPLFISTIFWICGTFHSYAVDVQRNWIIQRSTALSCLYIPQPPFTQIVRAVRYTSSTSPVFEEGLEVSTRL